MLFPSSLVYTSFICGIEINHIVAGVPANPKIVAAWLKTRIRKGPNARGLDGSENAQRALLQQTLMDLYPTEFTEMLGIADDAQRDAMLDNLVEKYSEISGGTVFKRDLQGYACIEGRQPKAGLKENGNIAFGSTKFGQTTKVVKPPVVKPPRAKRKNESDSDYQAILSEHAEQTAAAQEKYEQALASDDKGGGKQWRSDAAERIHIPDRLIRLCDADGGPIEPERDTRPIRVLNQGQFVSALKTYEFIEKAYLEFEIRVDKDRVEEFEAKRVWEQVWPRFQNNGLGADRSQSAGTFEVIKWVRQ
jgi:hypothetical protein